VYARLSAPANSAAAKVAQEEPVLGAIKTTEVLPLGMDAALEQPGEVKEEARVGSASLDVDSLFAEPAVKDAGVTQTRSLANVAEENLAEASKVIGKSAEPTKNKQVSAPVERQVGKISTDSASVARVTVKGEEKILAAKTEKVLVKTAVIPVVDSKKTNAAAKAEVNKAKVVPAAAAKASEKSLVRETLPPGWFAQVAAPRKMQDATSLAGRLKASGFPVIIEAARVRGEEYFRVIVGPEQNKQQAERLVGQLKRESYVQGEPFLRVAK
jgi:cell division septation protein DedD